MQKKLCYSVLFLFVALMSISCGDDCTAPALSENIVGKWKITLTGEEIEFKADGTLIDPNDGLIGGELNGVVLDEKSYEIVDGDTFSARAAKDTQFLESEFNVTLNECDKITIADPFFGLNIAMERQ